MSHRHLEAYRGIQVMRWISRSIDSRRVVMSMCLAVMAAAVFGTSALAKEVPAGATAGASTVVMTLDCVHMSQKVHAYAISHGYCPDTGTSSAAVVPGSTTSGNCGSSWLLRWDASG